MKNKNIKFNNWGGFVAFIALAWPAAHLFRSIYTPTQLFCALFSFIGVRLCYRLF